MPTKLLWKSGSLNGRAYDTGTAVQTRATPGVVCLVCREWQDDDKRSWIRGPDDERKSSYPSHGVGKRGNVDTGNPIGSDGDSVGFDPVTDLRSRRERGACALRHGPDTVVVRHGTGTGSSIPTHAIDRDRHRRT